MLSKVPPEERNSIHGLFDLAQRMQPARMSSERSWQLLANFDAERGINIYSFWEARYLEETRIHGTVQDYYDAFSTLDKRLAELGLPLIYTQPGIPRKERCLKGFLSSLVSRKNK